MFVNFNSMAKDWFRSKGVWGGILIGVGALYGYFMGDNAGGLVITTMGLGLLGIGIRENQG